MRKPDCAFFATTSGHSGVDRLFRYLIEEFSAGGLRVDLLRVRNHGPHLEQPPSSCRVVSFGAGHASTSLPALSRYLNRERPRVLLTDKDKVNRMAIIARRLTGVETRLAVRIGTHVSTNLARKGRLERALQRWSMRNLYPLADRVIVPSAGVADDLAEFAGLPRSSLSVLPNPAVPPNLEALAAAPVTEPWQRLNGEFLLVTVGALNETKDLPTLLDALARLRRTVPARLLVLGRGPQRGVVLRRIADLGLEDVVHLVGFVENPYAWMARADCYVQASRWEGFGIALVEALALGVPVVSTDCPSGPREILDNGRYGRLVPVGDVDALAEAIAATLDAPPERGELRKAAEPYTVQRSAAAYRAALGLGADVNDDG